MFSTKGSNPVNLRDLIQKMSSLALLAPLAMGRMAYDSSRVYF